VGDGWELLQRIGDLLYALVDVLWSFGVLLYVLLPVGLWCVWWLCAVDWKRLWPVLARGAWAPLVLLMVVAALGWSRIDPGRFDRLPFLTIPPFWWHLGAVALLTALALFCGYLQGVLRCAPAEVPIEPPAAHAAGTAHPHGYDHAHH
jgi:hypothetical protein